MPKNSSSKCQLFQLHIDAFLDDELEPARATELKTHLDNCRDCSDELAYAEQLHRAVVDLPILDCSDQALEPVDRLFANNEPKSGKSANSIGQWLNTFKASIPGFIRYGIPTTAVVLLAIALGNGYLEQRSGAERAAQEVVAVVPNSQYSQEEILKALQDLEVAIDYLGQISQRTNVMIEDRFFLRQLEDAISASFRNDVVEESANGVSNGPI